MAKRYKLLARAQIHGAVRDPGYVFTLEDGELGPHRTVVASNHGAQITDRMREAGQALVDEPTYEEYVEPETEAEAGTKTDEAEVAAKVAETKTDEND